MRFPLLDLYPVLQDCKIVVSVGEATDSKCSGTITIVIVGTNSGQPTVLTEKVENLGRTMQEITFVKTPKTGKLHPVIATLVLDSGESRKDNETIKLCQ